MTEKMKPSGIAWIGDIPTEWDLTKVRFATKVRSEKGYYCAEDKYIGLENISSYTGKYIPAETEYDPGLYDIYREGDVLFSKLRPYLAKALIADDNGFCTGELEVISDYLGDKRFLFYYLLSDGFLKMVDASTYGTKMPRANWEYIKNLQIPVVPCWEQCAIADYLDAQCAKIDSVIADIEKQIEILQKYKKSLITEAVTKGLDQSISMKDSGIEWIGKIPSHWRVIRITKYLDSLVDYRGKTPEKVDDGVFLVTARNIKNGIVDYSLSQEYVAAEEYEQIMHRGKPEVGDVLFTTEAPLGEVANVDRTDIALAQRVIKFSGRKGCVDNYYLKYWLMSLGFQSFLWSLATGSTALGIAASKLGQLKMVLPPIDEQKAIAERLDCDCTTIDAIIVEKRKQLETAQQYKKSLIYEYVTGKKRVTEVN